MLEDAVDLYHYTDSEGFAGIWRTLAERAQLFVAGQRWDDSVQDPFCGAGFHFAEAIWISTKATGRGDAHGGDGLYLTDISPGSRLAVSQAWSLFGNGGNGLLDRTSYWFAFRVPLARAWRFRKGAWIVKAANRRWLRYMGSGRNASYPFARSLSTLGALVPAGQRNVVAWRARASHLATLSPLLRLRVVEPKLDCNRPHTSLVIADPSYLGAVRRLRSIEAPRLRPLQLGT